MDPFFSYIEENRNTISTDLYAVEEEPRNVFFEIELEQQELPQVTLSQALANRVSAQDFDIGAPLHLSDLSKVLQHAFAYENEVQRKPYPSPGGFYEQTVFVIVNNVISLDKGIYVYMPDTHTLGLMNATFPKYSELKKAFLYDKFANAPALLCITMGKGQNFRKYGSSIYPHSFLEAGHMGQNVYLVAAALGIGCCAMGSCRYSVINELLNISGMAENYIYGLALGAGVEKEGYVCTSISHGLTKS